MTDQRAGSSELLLYQTEDGRTRIECRFEDETLWLSLREMTELFQRDKSVISRHIKNVFEEGELRREAVVAEFATTAADGKTYQVEYFNLDVIISVGYRVKSHRGTQLRIWATQRLREYIIKGFTLDDERRKSAGGENYFDELLARIRDIRSSEKAFYRKVLGDDTLRTIARELVETVRRNVSIDWTVKESVRAKLRVIVKRILCKHGYPPDKQEVATATVLQQAELLSDYWTEATA